MSYMTTPPVLTWTRPGEFEEIVAPEWWDEALEELFPLDGGGPPSRVCFGQSDGNMIEVWALRRPGAGYVLCLSGGGSDQILWVQDQIAYIDFMTSRGAAWLKLPELR